MAINHQQVRQALRKRLLDVDGLPGQDRLCWPNEAFTPPDAAADPDAGRRAVLWIRETYMPGADRLAATQQLEGAGIYQVDVFVPKNSGSEEATEMQRLIVAAFPPASAVADDDTGVAVAIDRATPLPGVAELVWYRASVQVTFRTYAATTSS